MAHTLTSKEMDFCQSITITITFTAETVQKKIIKKNRKIFVILGALQTEIYTLIFQF
jgi:hypothetical protein